LKVVFIELKSRRGTASRVQRQIRLELLQVGATWWIARSARACMLALYKEGVTFKRKWTPPKTLRPWEGPSEDPQHLPLPPEVLAERREAKRRWRERQRARSATQPRTSASCGYADTGARVRGHTPRFGVWADKLPGR